MAEKQWASRMADFYDLKGQFKEEGFSQLQVTGFGYGFNDEMRHDSVQGKGFDSAIDAFQQSMTKTNAGGLQSSVSPFDLAFVGGAIAKGGLTFVAGAGATGAASGAAPLSRGAQLRLKYGNTYNEYARFRSQGFTPAQSKYLSEPYVGAGHHFPLSQSAAQRWGVPNSVRDSSFNVLRPAGINRGRFYELHYKVDPNFHNANFPRHIGGSWTGSRLGIERYSPPVQWWHATPGATKAAGAATAGGSAAYWLGSE